MDLPKFDEMFSQIYKNIRLSGIPSTKSQYLGLKFYIPHFWLVLMIIEELSFFVSRISPENFLELTALAPCIGIGALSYVKILCIALKRHEIYELIKCLKQLYQDQLNDPKKRELVTPEIIQVKRLTKYFFVLNIILISIYNSLTVFLMLYVYFVKHEVIFMLPYPIIVPFSTDSWLNWSIVYFHSCMSGFICVLYYTTTDALYYNLSCHVCNNFIILSDEIQQLNSTDAHKICNIIKRHQYILRLSEDLEDIFAAPNLFNILVGAFEICALGFSLVMTNDWTKLPGFILFLFSELLQIFLMSYFGENLIRKSMAVGEAAFCCEWYNMDPKSKYMILIIMTRASKPQRLTAYKFSSISYQSFTKVISSSWSYFTILRTVYSSPENNQ